MDFQSRSQRNLRVPTQVEPHVQHAARGDDRVDRAHADDHHGDQAEWPHLHNGDGGGGKEGHLRCDFLSRGVYHSGS